MTSMLLADSGADVLRIEAGAAPDVDPVAYRVWHRGQAEHRAGAGLAGPSDRSQAAGGHRDVLIESLPPGVARPGTRTWEASNDNAVSGQRF
jgi:hypothetical protein